MVDELLFVSMNAYYKGWVIRPMVTGVRFIVRIKFIAPDAQPRIGDPTNVERSLTFLSSRYGDSSSCSSDVKLKLLAFTTVLPVARL